MRHPICPLCGLTHHPDATASIDCQVETIDRIEVLRRNLNGWRKLCEQTELELRKLEAEAAELRKMVPSVAPVQAAAFVGCDHERRILHDGRWLCARCGRDCGPIGSLKIWMQDMEKASLASALTGSERIADPHPVTEPAEEPNQ